MFNVAVGLFVGTFGPKRGPKFRGPGWAPGVEILRAMSGWPAKLRFFLGAREFGPLDFGDNVYGGGWGVQFRGAAFFEVPVSRYSAEFDIYGFGSAGRGLQFFRRSLAPGGPRASLHLRYLSPAPFWPPAAGRPAASFRAVSGAKI